MIGYTKFAYGCDNPNNRLDIIVKALCLRQILYNKSVPRIFMTLIACLLQNDI